MQTINKYNSSYPLVYYIVGNIYSFYGKKNKKGILATKTQIEKYANILDGLEDKSKSTAIKPVEKDNNQPNILNRFYAVVVDKVENEQDSYIVVMFRNTFQNRVEYYTKKYAVDYGCDTDDKDLMPILTSLNFAPNINKVGKITLVNNINKVGKITQVREHNTQSAGVGQITKVREEKGCKEKDNEVFTNESKDVGRITLVRK